MRAFDVRQVPRFDFRPGRGRPGPDRRQWIVRPEDLLVLGFDRVNLRVEPGEGRDPAQLVKDGRGQAVLIVIFPPQHLAEIAYFTTVEKLLLPETDPDGDPKKPSPDEEPDPPPIDARIAGWSRLAFLVPDERLPIKWTLDSVLEAMHELELSVPANALPPREGFYYSIPHAVGSHILVASALVESGAAAVASQLMAAPQTSEAAITRAAFNRAELPLATQPVVAVARSRRLLRVAARTLGITEATGSATVGLHEALLSELQASAIRPELMRPVPRPPAATQTAIELPFRLILAPNRFGAWFHADHPATSAETGGIWKLPIA